MSMFAEKDPFSSIVANLGVSYDSLGYTHRLKDGENMLVDVAEGEELREMLLMGYGAAKADLRFSGHQVDSKEYNEAITRELFEAFCESPTETAWQSEFCVFGADIVTMYEAKNKQLFELDESLTLFGLAHALSSGRYLTRGADGSVGALSAGLLVLSNVIVCENSGYGQLDSRFDLAEIPITNRQLTFGRAHSID